MPKKIMLFKPCLVLKLKNDNEHCIKKHHDSFANDNDDQDIIQENDFIFTHMMGILTM